MSLRVGVDVGGTFTDVVLFDPGTNSFEFAKTSSTPANQAVGVQHGIEQVIGRCGVAPVAIGFLAHGTTVATNALLERRGVPCGLLVTEGFRDILHIARQDRPKLYDWFARRPEPLVPRHLTFEVRERTLYTGEVLVPLDEAQAIEAIGAARTAGVKALAVSLLHSYANSSHERRLLQLIREHFPEAEVSISSEILPEFKEYERTSTTVMNAYVMPIVRRYVNSLEDHVRALGIPAGVHIMQSNGGIMTARAAGQKSVHTMLSGPAAGVLGAVSLARQAGFENVITVDMGGTSFDICLAHRGELRFTKEGEIGGLPIKVPMLDMHTLGAGGGSIAWIDEGGALRVGPRSAGASPGPACYARDGQEATVTDANLVLGRLSAEFFLGGEMRLDLTAARRAIEERISRPLGMSVEQAAEGIVRVIDATMARGVRAVSVQKGYDPREFTLVAFGGGGPVHATELARELGAPRVLVPLAPGVTSALGLLMADFRYDFSTTYLGSLSDSEPERISAVYAELESQAVAQMTHDGLGDDILLTRTAEVRYRRQGFELDVPVPAGMLDRASLDQVGEAFHELHARLYGYAMRGDDLVLVNAQVSAVAPLPKPGSDARPRSSNGQVSPLKGHRRLYLAGEWVSAAVYDRGLLNPGSSVDGPAIVEQADSTTVLAPGDHGRIDGLGNLIVTLEARS